VRGSILFRARGPVPPELAVSLCDIFSSHVFLDMPRSSFWAPPVTEFLFPPLETSPEYFFFPPQSSPLCRPSLAIFCFYFQIFLESMAEAIPSPWTTPRAPFLDGAAIGSVCSAVWISPGFSFFFPITFLTNLPPRLRFFFTLPSSFLCYFLSF